VSGVGVGDGFGVADATGFGVAGTTGEFEGEDDEPPPEQPANAITAAPIAIVAKRGICLTLHYSLALLCRRTDC